MNKYQLKYLKSIRDLAQPNECPTIHKLSRKLGLIALRLDYLIADLNGDIAYIGERKKPVCKKCFQPMAQVPASDPRCLSCYPVKLLFKGG